MQRSVERILTTHTGSLPRADDLTEQLLARDRGELADAAALAARAREAVAEVVRRQVEAGVALVNDGEQSKSSYATYVKDRLTGFAGPGEPVVERRVPPDVAEFPGLIEARRRRGGSIDAARPSCTGPISYQGEAALQHDIANLQAALAATPAAAAFMTAASPGVVAYFMGNRYYPDEEAYIDAVADAMRPEYEAIVAAGVILQLDCPDLGAGSAGLAPAANRRRMEHRIAALNRAVAGIPAERMRLHLCWGNYEGPHHHDVPLGDLLDVLWQAKPAGLSFEAANPRHAHEWQLFETVRLPAGKVLIPGVLDSTTNYIEHPDLVAQRIVRYARLVGRENVVAGSDCGFATWAGPQKVDPGVVWAKLAAMAEGARRASVALWS
jgi:5-methyltetrahydropteroyltriglutamate--homocysteine methyltransferase